MRSLIILSLLFSNQVFAQEVSTEASNSADLQVLYVAKHPSKFMKCWGRPTESHVNDHQGSGGTGNTNEGSLSSDGGGKHLQDVTWASTWTEEDEFKIQYKKSLMKTHTEYKNMACTKKSWTYKVSRSEAHVKTNVKLTVPDGIWVVGLKGSYSKIATIPTMSVSNTLSANGNALSVTKNFNLQQGIYEYQFVRPFDEISLDVTIDDSGLKDEQIAAEIEVSYLGQSRCEKIIQENKGYNTAALESAVARANSGEMNLGLFNQYLSCVSSPKHLNQVLYQNGPTELQALETSISQLGRNLGVSHMVRAVITKAQFEIANKVMNDIELLCKPTQEKNYSSLSSAPARRGYVYASYQYQRMNAFLDLINPEPYTYFATAIQTASETYSSYADLKKDTNLKTEVQNLAKAFQDRRLWVVQLLQGILDDLPQTKVGESERDDVRNALEKTRLALILTNQLVQDQINQIATSQQTPLQVEDLLKATRDLDAAKQDLVAKVSKSGELYYFDSGYTTFNSYALAFTDQFFGSYFNYLFHGYSGFLQEYLSNQLGVGIKDAQKYVDDKQKEIQSCLTSLTSK